MSSCYTALGWLAVWLKTAWSFHFIWRLSADFHILLEHIVRAALYRKPNEIAQNGAWNLYCNADIHVEIFGYLNPLVMILCVSYLCCSVLGYVWLFKHSTLVVYISCFWHGMSCNITNYTITATVWNSGVKSIMDHGTNDCRTLSILQGKDITTKAGKRKI